MSTLDLAVESPDHLQDGTHSTMFGLIPLIYSNPLVISCFVCCCFILAWTLNHNFLARPRVLNNHLQHLSVQLATVAKGRVSGGEKRCGDLDGSKDTEYRKCT